MKRVITGVALVTAVITPLSAGASPRTADTWIGVEGTSDGFLLNSTNGELWMTGTCLKPLAMAKQTGDEWVSRTREVVSVGRNSALLDQTFRLTAAETDPSVTVVNPARGGKQIIQNVVRIDCTADRSCARFADAPTC